MNNIPDTSVSDFSSNTPPGIEPAEVEQALATILADDKFAAAPQMSAFLAYVVKQTLRGEADRIKAYTVAVDALGKPATFDPQNDPSVRVLAKRLRSSIDHYYGRTEGHSVIIELKSGSYKPRFVRAGILDTSTASSQAVSAVEDTQRSDAAAVTEVRDCRSAVATESEPAALQDTGNVQALDQPRPVAADGSGSAELAPASAAHVSATTADGSARQKNRRGVSAALRRLPHPAVMAITVLAIGWGITQHQQETRLRNELNAIVNAGGVNMGDQPLQIALASSSDGQNLRTRPALPTVHLPDMQDQDALSGTVSASITRVLSRFENIEVVRQQNAMLAQWPEDYELHFSDYQLGSRVRVEAQLLHGATGRVVSVDAFDLPDLTKDKLTAPELAEIEAFAARLAQLNGPLIRDYLSQSDLSPAVACALGMDPDELMRQGGDTGTVEQTEQSEPAAGANANATTSNSFDCDQSSLGNGQQSALDLTQQAVSLLGSLLEHNGTARERILDKALVVAQRAVESSPYSAAAHTVLMNSLQEKGRHDEALVHGKQALAYNRYDVTTLRSVARVMDSLNLTDDSATLRSEAMRLDPGSASAVALNRG